MLDLSTPAAVKEINALRGECTGGRSVAAALHHPETWRKPQVPLKLEIINLSATSFTVGDDMTAELKLTNVGEAPVMLPWDIHASTVYGPKPTCRWPKEDGAKGLRGVLAVYLETEDVKVGHGYGAIVYLYGISTKPDSYRYLPVGNSARFRISSSVFVPPQAFGTPQERKAARLPRTFTAYAVFKLDNSSERGPYEDFRSTNQLTVSVLPNEFPIKR